MLIGQFARGLVFAVVLLLDCTPLAVEPTGPGLSAGAPSSNTSLPATGGASLAASPPPELAAAPPLAEWTAPRTPETASLAPLTPLNADAAMDQVVERAPLPPEARFFVRTLRPAMVAESDGFGHWVVNTGVMGQWRVDELTWQVEPHDGTAQLWELQSRLDLR